MNASKRDFEASFAVAPLPCPAISRETPGQHCSRRPKIGLLPPELPEADALAERAALRSAVLAGCRRAAHSQGAAVHPWMEYRIRPYSMSFFDRCMRISQLSVEEP